MHGHVAPLPGTVVRGPKASTCPTCGLPYERERSKEQHNLLFAVIREAFGSWPEQYKFQPTNERHLRGWLLVEAGHSISMDLEGARNITVRTVREIRSLLVSLGSDDTALLGMRMYEIPNGLRVTVPKSVAKSGSKRISKREYEDVSQKVYDLIEAIAGISVEECIKRAKYGAP